MEQVPSVLPISECLSFSLSPALLTGELLGQFCLVCLLCLKYREIFFFQSVFLTKDGVVLKLGSPKPGTTSTESAILYFYQKSTKVPVSAEPREQNKLANIIGSFQNRLAISHS